jgi:hypothetical protein
MNLNVVRPCMDLGVNFLDATSIVQALLLLHICS